MVGPWGKGGEKGWGVWKKVDDEGDKYELCLYSSCLGRVGVRGLLSRSVLTLQQELSGYRLYSASFVAHSPPLPSSTVSLAQDTDGLAHPHCGHRSHALQDVSPLPIREWSEKAVKLVSLKMARRWSQALRHRMSLELPPSCLSSITGVGHCDPPRPHPAFYFPWWPPC